MTEPDDTSGELSLGKPPALDPIGREIARMKIGDALFANSDERKPEVRPLVRDPKPIWRRRTIVVGALVAVALAIALVGIHRPW